MEYTREQLIELLRQKAERLGRTPSSTEVLYDSNMPSDRLYCREFKSWNNAVRAAGLEPATAGFGKKYTEQQLLDALRDCVKKLGRTPTAQEMNQHTSGPSSSPFIYRYGSWENATRELGFSPPPKRAGGKRPLSNERILQLLRDKAAKLGKTPSRIDVDSDPDMPKSATYIAHFGSWSAAIAKSGLNPKK